MLAMKLSTQVGYFPELYMEHINESLYCMALYYSQPKHKYYLNNGGCYMMVIHVTNKQKLIESEYHYMKNSTL